MNARVFTVEMITLPSAGAAGLESARYTCLRAGRHFRVQSEQQSLSAAGATISLSLSTIGPVGMGQSTC